MILDRLSSYMQNQPFSAQNNTQNKAQDASKADTVSIKSVLPKQTKEPQPEELHLSNRASYLEYLSQEFDVTSLSNEQLNQLQTKLNDYGFIAAGDLNGMRSLSLARQLTEPKDTINAVDLLNNFKAKFDELEIPYSMRQQVDKMSVVIQNMASARQLP
ncbi:MAG: hypothetical protein KBT75_06385 [Oleispira antarctica]|nr:hypothetical protein [Oleispira antarctica]MBQ0791862.1 hypothetical protein [Oleispira antarctica]|tara:strand:+ start:7447 stop:7923 length:477 start_codon:yes stop_codon:yes gene_type:complete